MVNSETHPIIVLGVERSGTSVVKEVPGFGKTWHSVIFLPFWKQVWGQSDLYNHSSQSSRHSSLMAEVYYAAQILI